MFRNKYLSSLVVVAALWGPATAVGQTQPATSSAAKSAIRGVVTADDVYVRSGDSTNHYTICKLNTGTAVTIVGERGDWYEILPPSEAFSLISGDYVDTADGKTGTVNGHNVRVRAGSSLNDNKYTVQTMLDKGATVSIIRRNPDGFLQIEPPPGATLWIHRSYVRPEGPAAGSSATAPERNGQSPTPRDAGAAQLPTSPGTNVVGSPVGESRGTDPADSTPSTAASARWRAQLTTIDDDAKAEVAKPTEEREFDDILERYREIAGQDDDEYARQYARARIEEIESMVALSDAIERLRQLDEDAETKRRQYLEGRAKLPNLTEPVPRGIQVQGELRISALYPPGAPITRYRLIDPAAQRDRTIAYVEIPDGSNVQVDEFIGRYVGVLAHERRMHRASVDPVPIYIATELVPLEPPGDARTGSASDPDAGAD